MRIFNYLKRVTSPFIYWLFFFHFLYLYQIHVNESMGGFYFSVKGVSLILLSFVPVACLFYLVQFLFNRFKLGLLIGTILLVVFYSLGAAYHFHSTMQFEWSLLQDNFHNACYVESLIYVWNSLDKDALIYGGVFIFILLFMQWRYRSITRYQGIIKSKKPLCIVVLCYCLFLFTALPCYDPVSSFLKSSYVYYFKFHPDVDYKPGEYPLLKKGNQNFNAVSFNSSLRKPSVFLIVVESLNGSVIGKKTDEGRYITPFLNKLVDRSVYVDRFYANSIQSARGILSLLFSLVPNVNDKVTKRYPDISLQSVGKVMSDNGYKSVVFLAQSLNNFDNLLYFLKKNDFEVLSVDPYIEAEDKPYVWRRWGPEDRVFFKRFFDYYDQQQADDQPLFVSLVTSVSHVPFSSVPESRRLLYKNPVDIHEEYANIIYLVDQGIEVFFEELRKRNLYDNSIVLITSDHTIPMGEHGIYHQEAGYYEESFRIPLWIHWPEGLKNQKIRGPFSQIDIAPTILDLVDANVEEHHFMGKSIFSESSGSIFLVQPYGKYLASVKWPYKFIWSSRSGEVSVYDLENDPMELEDIRSVISDQKFDDFQASLNLMFRQQLIYQHNAVFR